ncbi:MAG: DUF222 domain-containing protein [Actinomadura sp.]
MRAARRLTAWAESVELAAIGELDRRRDAQAGRYGAWTVEMCRAECDEISAALTLSATAASIRLGMAISLEKTLPATRRALVEGRIDVAKARVICDGTVGVSEELAGKVERLVLPEAPGLTARQLAARVRKAVVEADPEAFAERRTAAEKGRHLARYDNPDGTGEVAVRDVPADAADAAYNYVSALAAAMKADGDERPIDALRADVALDLLRGRRPADLSAVAAGPGGPSLGPRPAARPGRGSDPGETGRDEAIAVARAVRDQLAETLDRARGLAGHIERRLLATEVARRVRDAIAPLKTSRCHLAVGSDGEIVHGHDGYRPPAAMRRLIQTRNDTCVFPTCRRRAEKCDLDHTIPHHKGGPTCPCNLAPLCRGHHLLKQHPDWTLTHLWPGVLLWIAPTGHWYLVGPDP